MFRAPSSWFIPGTSQAVVVLKDNFLKVQSCPWYRYKVSVCQRLCDSLINEGLVRGYSPLTGEFKFPHTSGDGDPGTGRCLVPSRPEGREGPHQADFLCESVDGTVGVERTRLESGSETEGEPGSRALGGRWQQSLAPPETPSSFRSFKAFCGSPDSGTSRGLEPTAGLRLPAPLTVRATSHRAPSLGPVSALGQGMAGMPTSGAVAVGPSVERLQPGRPRSRGTVNDVSFG